jgi:hypothetical protein
MKIIKVTNVTEKEITLRNYIFFDVLNGLCNFEDYEFYNDEGYYDFNYGSEMKSNTLNEWAEELKWDVKTVKGVLGSLTKKEIVYFEPKNDSEIECITMCKGEEKNNWLNYGENGQEEYKWEMA